MSSPPLFSGRGMTQRERRQQSEWRGARRLWLSQLAAMLPAVPDVVAALREALSACLSRRAVPSPGGALVSLGDACNPGGAGSAAVTEAAAAAEGGVAAAVLRIAMLADALQTLRALAGWQLSAADAARLRTDLVPAVRAQPHHLMKAASLCSTCSYFATRVYGLQLQHANGFAVAKVCLELRSAAAARWTASTPLPKPLRVCSPGEDDVAPDAATLQMQRLDLR